jgi:PAS domain S-box-containing protein
VKLQSRHIFTKSILIALIFSLLFWVAESAAHMFYFSETFEYFLNHEPLTFMDAFVYQVPKYSLLIRLICAAAILLMGGIIGLLLERDCKRTALSLARAREYHDAINAVNEGIFTYLIGSDKINASTLCYSMLGYTKDELGDSREAFYSLIAPEEREKLKESLLGQIAKNESFLFELKMKTKQGKWKWILMKGNVQETNPDGSAKRIMGIAADIDQQMKIRNKLEHYTACLEEAEKVAHVGHWEFNYKEKKDSWSREIFNILQIPYTSKVCDNQRAIMHFVHPEDKKRIRQLFLGSIRKQCNFDFTYRILLKDKNTKYVSQHGHHVFDKNGHIIRSFGTIQDITSSSLATQALTNSEKRYRTLFDNVHQGIIIVEQESGKIKLANRIFCELTGHTQQEILNCHLKDLHPSENFNYNSSWIKVKKKSFSGNVDCLRKDGSTFHAGVYASSIMLEGQACVIAIFRDLTETYQAEYDRYMLKSAVDNSDVEFVLNNLDGVIDYCSPALCRRLGYSYEEIKKMHIWDIERSMTKKEFDTRLEKIKSTKTQKGEGIQIGKDGTKFEISFVADYVKIGNRELVCCSIRDVTESKKREAILENAKQKAEESDRLKSVFLANISHEIRTPMNGILGFADLLLRDNLSLEKCQQYAKIISDCGNNLMQLLNDILDLSRIEAGEVKINKEDFCVNEIIEELYNFYEPQTRQDGKQLSLQMHKSLRNDEAVIYSDKRYLRQILTNLLSNALKFTKKGEILIGYNAKQSGIEFFVKDSGEGIAPELLDKIFEPFRQGEEILSRTYHGTGLGLTIAKNYIELLGGYMRVESEVDHGTIFYLILPYSKNIRIQTSPSVLSTETDYIWKDKTFLIVEDNHVSFMLLENLLEDTGVKIFRAETAQQSIDMAESIDNLDLILMDVRLPDFTGWEAAKIIKENHPDLPIVAQTANANASDKIKTFQAGCEAYLTKPIIKKEFYETIKKCLEK